MKAATALLKYLKPYTILAILGPLLMVLEVTMDLIQPTIMQHIIDTGIANSDHAYVVKLGLLMILSAIIGLIGGVGCSIYSSRAAVHFAADLRKELFHQIMYFSNRSKDSFGTGKLITIMTNDVETLQRALMMTLKIFVRGPLLFIGSVVIVFITARELFSILLVIVPILIGCMFVFTKVSGALFQKVQEAMDQVNTKLQENLAGIRVVKAFNRGRYHLSIFSKVNEELTRRNIHADQIVGILMPLTMFIINIGIVVALWMGAIKINAQNIEIGVILAFINYLTIIMNGLISSSNVLVQIARAFPSARRIQEVLHTANEIHNPTETNSTSPIKGDVSFQHVSFSYNSSSEKVLKDITFSAKQGDTIGIIGSTGSGKSTLVKLIARLFDCSEGDIKIDGKSIKEYDLETLRHAIGFTPQKASLFSGSIAENVQYGQANASKIEIQQALADACANDFVSRFEDDVNHELSQGASNLSGGQRQRLSLARALIRKPSILILDDTTSAVDSLSEKKIQASIRNRYKDSTVFIIASKVSSIKHADAILVLEDGELVGKGTHEELLSENDVYKDIYSTQVRKGVR